MVLGHRRNLSARRAGVNEASSATCGAGELRTNSAPGAIAPIAKGAGASLARPLALIVALAALAAAPMARVDSWAGPQVREAFSASREHFVRVSPGESFGDTYGFAGASKGAFAKAEFYRRAADRSYRLTATATLLNPVAPVQFFVSDDGRLATVDNWHNKGYGEAVAIYDAAGKPVKSYQLKDLFLPLEIALFTHSVSSIHWHEGPVYINQDQKTLYLMVKSGADLVFGLETGAFAYCETRDGAYGCRNSNANRRWRPYAAAAVKR
jgi:hypothetical protein